MKTHEDFIKMACDCPTIREKFGESLTFEELFDMGRVIYQYAVADWTSSKEFDRVTTVCLSDGCSLRIDSKNCLTIRDDTDAEMVWYVKTRTFVRVFMRCSDGRSATVESCALTERIPKGPLRQALTDWIIDRKVENPKG